jgi:hypothetical protein
VRKVRASETTVCRLDKNIRKVVKVSRGRIQEMRDVASEEFFGSVVRGRSNKCRLHPSPWTGNSETAEQSLNPLALSARHYLVISRSYP